MGVREETRTPAGVLRARAESRPDDLAISFKQDDGWQSWTWSEYWCAAEAAAVRLREEGVRSGDHVLMLVPEVRPAVAHLFGLWLLGAVPIQVGLPFQLADLDDFVRQLEATARYVNAHTLILSDLLAANAPESKTFKIVSVGETRFASGAGKIFADPNAMAGPAFIQLTSGSTRLPKGVVIPHERLLLHMASMSEALPSHRDSVGVAWLPLYHDMGLVGGLLFPLYNGFPVHMMSSLDFKKNPFRWIEALAEFGANFTAAPPSAYAVMARLAPRAVQLELDLSGLECAMVGAEPIPPRVLRCFAEAYSACGFRPEAFFPVYGLAEATVAATFPTLLAPTVFDTVDRVIIETEGRAVPVSPGARPVEFVGVGKPIPGSEVRVVDEHGEVVADRNVANIILRSNSLMEGYYDDTEATSEVLRDGWLWTGDLGYRADGNLFVTGRKKELIIRGGRSMIPSALEEIVSGIDGVRSGCVAAVGLYSERDATEKVCIVAETRLPEEEHHNLSKRIRHALMYDGVIANQVILLPPNTLPRTTSGKLRRLQVADLLESSETCPGERFKTTPS